MFHCECLRKWNSRRQGHVIRRQPGQDRISSKKSGVNVKREKHCTTHKPSISKSRLSLTPALVGPMSSHISFEDSSNCRNIEESNSGGCVSY
jgi:hypothetical protein